MPCRTIDLGNGAFAIACSRGQRSKPCSVCGRRGEKLCDFPLTGEKAGKTCDRSLCRNCAVSRGPEIDYCPTHARMVTGMTFTVYGIPAPQGSKRAFVVKGRAVMTESSKAVKPWREAVRNAVLEAAPFGRRPDAILCRGPVFLDVTFTMPRPKSAKAGARPETRPDLDKLLRSTKDALTAAGAYEDDGRVVALVAQKVYPGDGEDALPVPGAVIRVACAGNCATGSGGGKKWHS